MKQGIKTALDIVMGAVIPVLILDRFSGPNALGPVGAYIFAAFVPVAWVFIDLLFVTRRFNFITSYIGFTALIGGLLAFWFVDGVLFAIKDTVGTLVRVLIFGGSVLVGRPILKYFFIQAINPDTPAKEAAISDLFRERSVSRSFVVATWIVVIESLIVAAINFYLNLRIVVAPFGSEAFNHQVAQVNAITRIALTIPGVVAFAAAMWLMYRAVYGHLPHEEGKSQLDSDFWELVHLRETQRKALGTIEGAAR